MATNMTDLRAERTLAEEVLRIQRPAHDYRWEPDAGGSPQREQDGRIRGSEESQRVERPAATATGQELALGPLVDQVAYGFAKVLVVAMKELEIHIANENKKLGESVGERLTALQASFNELTGIVSEQRSASHAIEEKCAALESATTALQQCDTRRQEEISALRTEAAAAAESIATRIDSAVASLQDADVHQQSDIAGIRRETKELMTSVSEKIAAESASLRECDARQESTLTELRNEANEFATSISKRVDQLQNDITVQQDDIAAIKAALDGFGRRVDSLVERLDKQAEAVHTMYTTYAQRESELEQVIEGLTRLRSVPTPTPAQRL